MLLLNNSHDIRDKKKRIMRLFVNNSNGKHWRLNIFQLQSLTVTIVLL